ncbi:hypothetical protein J5249_01121 [Campylobacter fetus subsp. fetus]|nr:hypothetical protein J5249_01121 [Campylobacter fetus subsp. fetus]
MEAVLNYINLKNLLYGLSLTLIMAFFAAVGSIIFWIYFGCYEKLWE